MKKLAYVLSILVLLSTACKNQEESPSTDISATSTDTATTIATDTAATRQGRGRTVQVKFVGLVCHLWSKPDAGVERAIVLRTPPSGPLHHKLTIALPPESRADIVKLKLPIDPVAKCPNGSTCTVLIDGLAFRFADRNGNPLNAAFSPNANFTNFVTHLRDVPHTSKPFDKKEDLIDAVFDLEPTANEKDVAGWFELTGGEGDAQSYADKGHFEGDPTERDFVEVAKVTYAVAEDGKLQVFIAGDTQWRDIAIPAGNFAISVDNDAATPMCMSHFDTYARLHKKKTATEPDIELPNVIVPNPVNCSGTSTDTTSTMGVDSVPGCSNSAWP
jgi:hypothetical protein